MERNAVGNGRRFPMKEGEAMKSFRESWKNVMCCSVDLAFAAFFMVIWKIFKAINVFTRA